MKKLKEIIVFFITFSAFNSPVYALDAPTMSFSISGTNVSISWTPVTGATGYTLYYAPYPYTGPNSIKNLDRGTSRSLSATLPAGSSFYVAIKAYDSTSSSGFSNVDFFILNTISFKVVDTGQTTCYNDRGIEMPCPQTGGPFNGQDAQYSTTPASYSFNTDQTVVIDNNTGLMWERAHHDPKISYTAAETACSGLSLGGYTDWRLPGIKELFSISNGTGNQTTGAFYLDNAYFDFAAPTSGTLTGTHTYGMMGQTWSTTVRPDKSTVVYFYNFLDAHIKSNSKTNSSVELFYRCVRSTSGSYDYSLQNNGDGTVSETGSGLMWQKANAEQSTGDYQFTWRKALSYCEDLSLAGNSDWRLPNIKELHSIVDYSNATNSLDTTIFTFNKTPGTSGYFWSSTTHGDNTKFASYIPFGEATSVTGVDIHGPGAQRSDPKFDDGTDYSSGIGDQKDYVQMDNYARCVR